MMSLAASGSCPLDVVGTLVDAIITEVVGSGEFNDFDDLIEDFAKVEVEKRKIGSRTFVREILIFYDTLREFRWLNCQ